MPSCTEPDRLVAFCTFCSESDRSSTDVLGSNRALGEASARSPPHRPPSSPPIRLGDRLFCPYPTVILPCDSSVSVRVPRRRHATALRQSFVVVVQRDASNTFANCTRLRGAKAGLTSTYEHPRGSQRKGRSRREVWQGPCGRVGGRWDRKRQRTPHPGDGRGRTCCGRNKCGWMGSVPTRGKRNGANERERKCTRQPRGSERNHQGKRRERNHATLGPTSYLRWRWKT